uniref:hypothetical protein n=1 Tax=Thaumasiovibrio occultus TaxID=1891184 RepID=UPI000B3598D4|nr:hypothetical protein [Thaumasiovibrio occultus]
MKYVAIATLLMSSFSFAQNHQPADHQALNWQLGTHTVSLSAPCTLQIASDQDELTLHTPFSQAGRCQIQPLTGTNIPNALVIGGAHVLVIEQQISTGDKCQTVSHALYLPAQGEVVLSEQTNTMNHCDSHLEPDYIMALIAPYRSSAE